MAAKNHACLAALQALRRDLCIRHIGPARGRGGIGMHEVHALMFDGHGEGRDKGALIFRKAAPLPGNGGLGHGIHAAGFGRQDRFLMIAEQRFGHAARHEIAHLGQHPIGIGAIAQHVAKKDDAINALPAEIRKAGFQRLTIGMDIGQDGETHGTLRNISRRGRAWQESPGPSCAGSSGEEGFEGHQEAFGVFRMQPMAGARDAGEGKAWKQRAKACVVLGADIG